MVAVTTCEKSAPKHDIANNAANQCRTRTGTSYAVHAENPTGISKQRLARIAAALCGAMPNFVKLASRYVRNTKTLYAPTAAKKWESTPYTAPNAFISIAKVTRAASLKKVDIEHIAAPYIKTVIPREHTLISSSTIWSSWAR